MSAVRQKNTDLERSVRSMLHRLGFRFRITRKDLPGTPDIVLPKWRVAIFVNGCFWHAHDCHFFKVPATRSDWWEAKLKRNAERDRQKIEELSREGWRTVVVWKCALIGKSHLSRSELEISIRSLIARPAWLSEIRGKMSSEGNEVKTSGFRANA